MMKTTVVMWFAASWLTATLASATKRLSAVKCDYDGFEARDEAPRANPCQLHAETVRLSTTDYDIGTVSSYSNHGASLQRGEAYCQVYCDSDPACLGFGAGDVVVEPTEDASPQNQHWIECRVTSTPEIPSSQQDASDSNSDARDGTQTCWRKIPESCRDVAALLPTVANAHAHVDPEHASCNTCVLEGCTWCEGEDASGEEEEENPEASLCVCEEFSIAGIFYGVCSDFLYGSHPKTECGQTTDDVDDESPSLASSFLWILLIGLLCTLCFCGLCCVLLKQRRGATTAGPGDSDAMYAANTGLDPTAATAGPGQQTDDSPGTTILFERFWEAIASGGAEILFGGDGGGGDGGCDGGGCGE